MPRILSPANRLNRPRTTRKPAPKWYFDPTHHLSRGLTAFFPLGDYTGGYTHDMSLYGRDGLITITAGNPSLTFGARGGLAYNNNSGTNYITGAAVTTTFPLSICCIYNGTVTGGAGNEAILVALTDPATLNDIWISIFDPPSVTPIHFRTGAQSAATAGTQRIFDCSATYDVNAPHHLVGVFPGATSQIAYVDGVAQAGSYSQSANVTPSGITTLSTGALIYNGSTYYGQINGSIECVRVYNRALSSEEVQQLYMEPYAGLYEMPLSFFGRAGARAQKRGYVTG